MECKGHGLRLAYGKYWNFVGDLNQVTDRVWASCSGVCGVLRHHRVYLTWAEVWRQKLMISWVVRQVTSVRLRPLRFIPGLPLISFVAYRIGQRTFSPITNWRWVGAWFLEYAWALSSRTSSVALSWTGRHLMGSTLQVGYLKIHPILVVPVPHQSSSYLDQYPKELFFTVRRFGIIDVSLRLRQK